MKETEFPTDKEIKEIARLLGVLYKALKNEGFTDSQVDLLLKILFNYRGA